MGPDLEPVAFIVVFTVSRSTDRRSVALSLLREAPVTGDFLVVLKADLDSLASVDADAIEVESLRVEGQLGDRDVGNEVDGVLGTILDVDGDRVLLLAELRSLASGEYDVEVLASIGKKVSDLVRLDIKTGSLEGVLPEVERDLHLASVSEAERPACSLADDDIAKVTHVASDVDTLVVRDT